MTGAQTTAHQCGLSQTLSPVPIQSREPPLLQQDRVIRGSSGTGGQQLLYSLCRSQCCGLSFPLRTSLSSGFMLDYIIQYRCAPPAVMSQWIKLPLYSRPTTRLCSESIPSCPVLSCSPGSAGLMRYQCLKGPLH